ncbi:prepilin-type N-terminal cleavage/methylation domain-containing protein [Massilia sp. Dwa41.01b]|uniref:prepilin-type N-terminal cleavage/methylation domain-containing protein n=1 Tax=unclassified Massilia TaxID=2609279 RepID=UPI0015FF38E9|nr:MULTISPECIES: prepilin-type N-terminal cleavage/methylation domain-containing protein [unclassified Massilia]QNA88884.1 prepilin-type N-terminal cleavage/methylation domain-containing protein [Massilia sp. Dwa41.01b]QNA99776.1 prepilin-type N-terminal cleavage/methylation domain-containing protein [Massilia sp. Se16.2.3]
MSARTIRRAQHGFTLVEAVLVIAIIGILGAIVAVFLRAPIQGYVDSVARAETTDDADLALRRMARDIRLALPNSVRVNANGDAIEFLMTSTGGRYLAADEGAAGTNPLDFENSANRAFDVVGWVRADINVGDLVVVYNLGPGIEPVDAYQINAAGAFRNAARVAARVTKNSDIDTATRTILLADNPFAQQSEPMPSPSRRFQVVSGAVSYRCEGTPGNFVLRRYEGYTITPAMSAAAPTGGRVATMATRVSTCANLFRYDNALDNADNLQVRASALVILTLALRTRNGTDPAVRLVHQVHVDNTP